MDNSEVITLVSLPTLRSGDIRETETMAYASLRSVSYRETYAAAAVGIKPELMVSIAEASEYTGQPFVRHNGNLYKVYRTYQQGLRIDLTLVSPVGLRDKIDKCYLGTSQTPAWCAVAYVQLSELDDAGLSGLIHELHLIVGADAYHGEDVVKYDGRMYAIRRTFQEDRALVDLYVEERAGL